MRTKVKNQTECEATREALLGALNSAEAEMRMWRTRAETAEADITACRRGKDAWMGECNLLHQRLDEISKLAGKALTADAD